MLSNSGAVANGVAHETGERDQGSATRITPHSIYLMALRGRKTLHGRTLPSAEEAAASLRRLTGEDFGLDAANWSAWLRANRSGLYRRTTPGVEETPT